MKFLRKNVYRALAVCYRAAYLLHHKFFLRPDLQLPQKLGTTKLIVVGSYRTGGAGKTPFCLWLAKELSGITDKGSESKHVSILCHSYAYDEIQMYHEVLDRLEDSANFIEVLGTRNRHKTILQLLSRATPPDVIICDDGFEDSRLAGAVSIVLENGDTPRGIRDLWPAGNCRSLPKDHGGKLLSISPQEVSFSIHSITNDLGTTINPTGTHGKQVNVLCGIGDPERFLRDLQYTGITIGEKRFLRDHCRSYSKVLRQSLESHPEGIFVITHKDACRLEPELRNNPQIFTANQTVCIKTSAIKKIRLFLQAL